MSAILGLGLASLFRRTCKDLGCFSFRAPPWEETLKSVYKYGDHCYKFKPRAVPCTIQGHRHIEPASGGSLLN